VGGRMLWLHRRSKRKGYLAMQKKETRNKRQV
jgi:hypothetical protein